MTTALPSEVVTLNDFLSIVALAHNAAASYYGDSGEVTMEDAEYDALLDLIQESVDAHPEWSTEDHVDELLNAVSAGTVAGGGVHHEIPMLSLAKTTSLSELAAFIESLPQGFVVVEPKVDGIASVAKYVDGVRVQVATRGDGQTGEDITSKIDALTVTGLPKTLATPVTVEVRGEIYMSPADFEFSNAARVASGGEPFANPRNATSGTVMRETVRYAARVSFAAYEFFGERAEDSYTSRINEASSLGFSVARDLLPESKENNGVTTSIVDVVAEFGVARSNGEIAAPTDGCVIKVNSTKARNDLGSGSRTPRWAMAFKFDALRSVTRLLDIERAVGRTGNLSYTAILEPVAVAGSIVGRSTLHNAAFIAERDLRIGDKVVLYKAGDVIPRVDAPVISARGTNVVAYVPLTTCPGCSEELDRSGAIWRCHTASCSIAAAISYAVSRDCLDVDGFSTAIADALVESEMVTRLSDIFYLSQASLAALPMGTTSTGSIRVLGNTTAAKILAGLEASKNQSLARIVCSLGIKMTGRGMSRRLAAAFGSMDALVNATEREFLNKGIDAVGPARATAFVRGFSMMSEDIARMAAAGVKMVEEVTPATAEASDAPKPLAGMKVVVTGTVPGLSRNEAAEAVERLGGIPSGSVSKATSLVVVGEGAGSKAAKAEELGVRIMAAEEFAALAGVTA